MERIGKTAPPMQEAPAGNGGSRRSRGRKQLPDIYTGANAAVRPRQD